MRALSGTSMVDVADACGTQTRTRQHGIETDADDFPPEGFDPWEGFMWPPMQLRVGSHMNPTALVASTVTTRWCDTKALLRFWLGCVGRDTAVRSRRRCAVSGYLKTKTDNPSMFTTICPSAVRRGITFKKRRVGSQPPPSYLVPYRGALKTVMHRLRNPLTPACNFLHDQHGGEPCTGPSTTTSNTQRHNATATRSQITQRHNATATRSQIPQGLMCNMRRWSHLTHPDPPLPPSLSHPRTA
jgi:hypothetical protein